MVPRVGILIKALCLASEALSELLSVFHIAAS